MTVEKDFVIKVQDEVKRFNASNNIITDSSFQSSNFLKIFISISDIILLFSKLVLNRNKKFSFVFTGVGLCHKLNGEYVDRLMEHIILENVIYINRDRDSIIAAINGEKTYNLGGVIKVISSFFKYSSKKELRIYYSYKLVNNFIFRLVNQATVYSFLFYNWNGLSLVFSKYRNNFKLIEVQHGTIVNFPAYEIPSQIKVADVFYVKNTETVNYLKSHLNREFKEVEYKLLPYPESKAVYKEGNYIFYASTVEFNGIHPVFMDYLKQVVEDDNVTLFIRLHPREKNKMSFFETQVTGIKAKIIFDTSKNWLESNKIKNLTVVSPWSSVIEDAVNNNYKTIILDENGRKRFEYLIDNVKVIFANDLAKLSQAIRNDI